MQGIKKQLWEMFVSVAEEMMENDPDIVFNYAAQQNFSDLFDSLYSDIKKRFMSDSVIYLDRHKVASIIIIALIRTNALGYGKKLENSMFWGNYKLAISIGLSYMINVLNLELRDKNQEKIDKYIMPEVFMDDISYIDVLSRNLYITENQNKSTIDVLNLANILFLLEHITLLKYNISPDVLKHY